MPDSTDKMSSQRKERSEKDASMCGKYIQKKSDML